MRAALLRQLAAPFTRRQLCTEAESADAVVIGAGVVGLACARALAQKGLETVVIEKGGSVGHETSSRSSEVIHAGIYYPQGSLKAALCVEGKQLLYSYCQERHVPHKQLTKLIVATTEGQVAQLKQLQQAGANNGVTDLELLTAADARALEPALRCAAALLSPSTGILDTHEYMQALLADAEASGAVVVTDSEVVQADVVGSQQGGLKEVTVRDSASGGTMQLRTPYLVNAAGLHAQKVAATFKGFPESLLPPTFYAKGNYFSLSTTSPFQRLIYPLPEPGGLGVHLTLDMGGRARFGPDVEWVDTINYEVSSARLPQFYTAIRSYYPGLPEGSLQPSYSGIRPKTVGPGEPAADFSIQGKDSHGIAGLVNLFGIESPGITASLAIAAKTVHAVLQQ